ncbi:type 1 fimbrial protein [Erwinia endophytica]|nr:type 1 fimbrial protein [Erwinia endophytica]
MFFAKGQARPQGQGTISALICLFLALFAGSKSYAVSDNLQFNGTLVADPCVLDPTTESVELDFGTVINKYLYINTRIHSQPFVIRLLECDLSLGTTVTMTFSGTADNELTDMLAITGTASGVAIGMELPDGTSLPFNKATPAFVLTEGSTELTLKGYVQGKPTAIQNRSIVNGTFNAVANFTLNYE